MSKVMQKIKYLITLCHFNYVLFVVQLFILNKRQRDTRFNYFILFFNYNF